MLSADTMFQRLKKERSGSLAEAYAFGVHVEEIRDGVQNTQIRHRVLLRYPYL